MASPGTISSPASPIASRCVDRDDDDLAVILYTAGTTGRPKGVALSHANLASNARAAASLYELDRTAWALMVLPLSHSYGLTVMNAGHILGTRGVLLRWFNPEGVLDTIQRYRVQSMAGVPTMFVYLLNYPDAGRFDTSSMRAWGSGAAPLPTEIVEPFEKKFGGRLLEGYGLTEASPVVSAHRFSGVRKLGSVGRRSPVSRSRFSTTPTRPAVGEVGEVLRARPERDAGLLPARGGDAADAARGWLHTGDMGRLDADGYLYIVERKKDLIIRGRLQRLSPRRRGSALRAPRGGRGRRGRDARSADGRGGGGLRGPQARRHHGRGDAPDVLPIAPGEVQIPQTDPLGRLTTQEPDRKIKKKKKSHCYGSDIVTLMYG